MTPFLHRLSLTLTLLLTVMVGTAFAQPANDECSGAVNLGANYFSYCSTPAQFTNVAATASSMPATSQPACFAGANDRDVWFHFTTDATHTELSLNVTGATGGTGMTQPQVAIYRGSCPTAGGTLLYCNRAVVGSRTTTIQLSGLDPSTDYYVRVNDYSLNATPNAGDFGLCLSTLYLLNDDYTPAVAGVITDCAGSIMDSGGHGNPPVTSYAGTDNYTATIQPGGSGCLSFTLDMLDIVGTASFQIYNGTSAAAPLLANLAAAQNSSSPRTYICNSGAVTIVFTGQAFGGPATTEGFVAHWSCAADCSVLSPCNALIYDPGGPSANYPDNNTTTYTYCPDIPARRMNIDFTNMDITDNDQVEIFDGANTLANSLGIYNNAFFGGTSNNQVIINASAGNASGCLTVVFTSDAAGNGTGYVGRLYCTKPCQKIDPVLLTASSSIVPPHTPLVALGDSAINVCVGATLTISAEANYPENNIIYPQNDATSLYTFLWGAGGDSTNVIGAAPHTASHTFNAPGIYFVKIRVADADSACAVTDTIFQRVRVAARPSFAGTLNNNTVVCVGQSTTAGGGSGGSGTIGAAAGTGITSSPPSSVSGSFCIPDNINTPLTNTITISGLYNATITPTCGVKFIKANFQHSFSGDLQIEISCPGSSGIAGQPGTAILKDYPGGAGTYFGLANDNLSTCTEGASPLGYAWSSQSNIAPSPFLPSLPVPANFNLPVPPPPIPAVPLPQFAFTMNTGLANGNTTAYPNPYMLANSITLTQGIYLPIDAISGPGSPLLGCPVNGDWTIRFIDNLGIDNGICYGWGIQFDNCLYPDVETYQPVLANVGWLPVDTQGHNLPTGELVQLPAIPATPPATGFLYPVTITPSTVGPHTFIFHAEYSNFPDCGFDTTITIVANPLPAIPTMANQTICVGTSAPLTAFTSATACPVPASYSSTAPVTPIPDNTATPVNSSIVVTGQPCTVSANNITQVCVDITHPNTGNLTLYLVSPTGSQIPLAVNQGTGANFANTCFTVNPASPLITAGTNPYTGSFRPSGNLVNGFVGVPLNGTWTLRVTDNVTGSTGTLNSWSMSITPPDPNTYSWTGPAPAAGATSNTVNASAAGTYSVTVTTALGCSATSSVTITTGSLLAPTVSCAGVSLNSVGFNWTLPSNATGYTGSYSVNGGAPVTIPAGQSSINVTGLAMNTPVTITLQSLGSCVGLISTQTCTTTNTCTITGSVAATVVPCASGTGTLVASAANTQGTTAPTYLWNTGETTASITITADGLTHTVTITDGTGATACTATAFYSAPTALTLNATRQNPTCLSVAFDDGSATVVATGGNATYTYDWAAAGNTATIGPLLAGVYTVTVTDGTGCSTTTSVTLINPTTPTVTATSVAALCNGGNGSVTAVGANGTSPYVYSWAGAVTPNNLASGAAPAGTYTVTATDAASCTATTQVTVVEPSVLAVTTGNMIPATCSMAGLNGSATATATGGTLAYTYTWDNGFVGATPTNLAFGTHTVTVTDGNGCASTATIAVGGVPAPSATITAVQPTCGLNNGSLAVNPTGGSAPYTYFWNGGISTPSRSNVGSGSYAVTVTDANSCTIVATTSLNVTTNPSLILNVTQPLCYTDGTITPVSTNGVAPYSYAWSSSAATTTPFIANTAGVYTVTVTDAVGCTRTATAAIVVPAAFTATASVVSNVLCASGTTGSATVAATGGSGNFAYAWATTPIQTTATATGLAAGFYNVTVTDNVSQCTSVYSVTISQPSPIYLAVNQTNAACFGANGSMTVFVSGGTTTTTVGYSYAWSTGTPPVLATTATVSLGAGNYIVTVTDANSCTATASSYIGQPGQLGVNTGQTDAPCFGVNGSVTAFPGSGTAPYTYSWSAGVVNPTLQTSPAPAGNYTVTVTDANGCLTSASTYVGQPGPLGINASQTNALCFGTNGTVSVVAVTGVTPYTYAWSAGVVNPTAASSPAPAGNYTVTVTDANGCTASASTFVGEPGPLGINTAQTDAPCFGVNGSVTAFPGSGTAPYNYAWSAGVINPTLQTSPAPAGNYTVTVTDANGCIATASTYVGQPGPLGINTAQTDALCFGANGTVSVSPVTGVAPYTYAWSTGVVNLGNPTSPAPAGIYTVTVTDANGCIATASTYVGQPGPLGINTAQTDALCFGLNGSVTAFPGSGTAPYTYLWSTGVINPTLQTSPALAGNYTVTVTDANSCTATASTYVGQPGPLSVVAYATDTTYYLGDVVTLAISQPTAGTYTWVNGTQTLGTGTLPNSLQVTPQAAQSYTYMVTVTNANNCTATAMVTVNIKLASMAMPSVFTPNGDGQNDKFYIIIAGEAEVKEFYIYNRWGQQLHNGATPWDGTFNGEPQPIDTYVYRAVVKQNGKETQMSGDFLLMR